MENFLEEIAPFNIAKLTQMRRVTNTNLLYWVNLPMPSC